MSANKIDTTDDVVLRPTPVAPPDAARPCWQAMRAIASAKTTLLMTPEKMSHVQTMVLVSVK